MFEVEELIVTTVLAVDFSWSLRDQLLFPHAMWPLLSPSRKVSENLNFKVCVFETLSENKESVNLKKKIKK